MSISSTATKVTYSGNNSAVTPYPISFKYLEDSHVNVYIDGVLQVEGAGQNYVLAGDGTAGTGTFTTTVAQAGTKSVVVVLDVALDQPVSLQETGSLPAKTLEQAYDRLNMQIRRVWRKAQDVLTFSSDEGGTGSQGTADNLLGFDGTGDLTEIPNTTFCQVANNLSDVTAATARTNLGVDAAGTDNSTDVTKAGTGTYVSLDTGTQVLTVDPIETSDINGFEAAVTANTSVAANTLKISATAANVKTGVEVASITDTGTPSPTDQFLYRDAISGDLQSADFSDFGASATDGDAIHKSTASEISALTDKATPVSGDFLVIEDSATGNTKKSITLGNLPLPAAGTVTETMLNTTTNDSLNLADTSLQVANNLSDVTASTARTNLGLGTLATQSAIPSATDTIEGIVELATQAEVDAGTDTARVVTPETLAAYNGFAAALTASDTAPTSPDDGALWYDSTTGTTYVYYNDGTSSQWVSANPTITTPADPSVTGTATFTNSTNNINLIGIGNLGGTIGIGDVIQITGSTGNNKLYTVEVRTDADNVIVNQAHAGETATALEGNKGLAGETSAVTITLYCKAKHAPLGLGQGWVEVTRGAPTVYNNLTGRTIACTAWKTSETTSRYYVDDVFVGIFNASVSSVNLSMYFTVPAGSEYYRDTGAVAGVSELR